MKFIEVCCFQNKRVVKFITFIEETYKALVFLPSVIIIFLFSQGVFSLTESALKPSQCRANGLMRKQADD